MSRFPESLIQNWIRYEYFKRNSDRETHQTICGLMRSVNRDVARNVFNQFTTELDDIDEGEPPMKRSRLELSSDEDPVDGRVYEDWPDDESIEEDDEWIDLHRIPDRDVSPERPRTHHKDHFFNDDWEPFEMEERQGFPVVEPSDQTFPFSRIRQQYEEMTEIELRQIKETRVPFRIEDLSSLLSIRQTKIGIRQRNVKTFQLPVKTLKVFIDYWKISIEIYEDPNSPKHEKIQYWYHEDGCWILYANGLLKFQKASGYPDVAAQDAFLIMSNLSVIFELLKFDIQPHVKGERYPNVFFFDDLDKFLSEWQGMDKSRRVSTKRLFVKNLRGPKYRLYQLNRLLKYIREGYLKYLTIRTWDDSQIIDKETQWLNVDPDQAKHPGGEAWKLATHLNIQQDLETNWATLVWFKRIKTDRIGFHELDDMVTFFKDYPPNDKCVITVDEPLKMEEFKYAMEKIKKGVIIDLLRSFNFHTDDKKKYLEMRFKSRRIEITTADIDPGDVEKSISPGSESSKGTDTGTGTESNHTRPAGEGSIPTDEEITPEEDPSPHEAIMDLESRMAQELPEADPDAFHFD
uniref:SPK domain-containing protein n=1 Tax=Caenorhabditis tropicalis TaxID=1561998 RepID=A0A1I7UV43_9PELO